MPKLRAVGPDFIDDAEVVLTTEVDLPATIDEVWAVIADNASWTAWLKGCSAVEATPPVWSTAGDTRTVRVGALSLEETAIAFDAGSRWAMRIDSSSLPMASAMIEMLELIDTSRNGETRTEVRWTGALDRLGYLRPFARFIEPRLADMWAVSLEALFDEVVARR